MLVNNAGVAQARLLVDLTEAEITQSVSVNLLGPLWTTRAFLPDMLDRRAGHIVRRAQNPSDRLQRASTDALPLFLLPQMNVSSVMGIVGCARMGASRPSVRSATPWLTARDDHARALRHSRLLLDQGRRPRLPRVAPVRATLAVRSLSPPPSVALTTDSPALTLGRFVAQVRRPRPPHLHDGRLPVTHQRADV